MNLAVKDMLIIEIRTDIDTRKNWFINLISEDHLVLCSLCEMEIIDNQVNCELCNQVIIYLFKLVCLLF